MTTLQLEAFVETARFQSYAAAGRHLGKSGAAIAKQVLRLELWLNCLLTVSSKGRGTRLTPRGEMFLRYAKRALKEADHVRTLQIVIEGRDAIQAQ
jgi:DNA-binding transcriptional LysR family regulator